MGLISRVSSRTYRHMNDPLLVRVCDLVFTVLKLHFGIVVTVGVVSLVSSVFGFKVGFRRLFAYYFVRICAFIFGLKIKEGALTKLIDPPREKYLDVTKQLSPRSPRAGNSLSKQVSRLSVNLSDIVPMGNDSFDEI